MKIGHCYTPPEITGITIHKAEKKAKLPVINMILLGILGGSFIAFASEGSNMAAFNLLAEPETYGLGKALAGAIFGTGLMLVVIAGGELFTGNTMMVAAVLDKKIKLEGMLKNWLFVYLGNLAGSVAIAYLMDQSGLFGSGGHLLGVVTVKIAVYKVGLSFSQAFFLGIMCNMLVCLAVWMAYGAKDMTGKILAIFFPIWLFITSGFEHCIANMYYIPAGIFAKSNPQYVKVALEHGMAMADLDRLNWKPFFINNLVPVTLGNILGGMLVASVYWFVYVKNGKEMKKPV